MGTYDQEKMRQAGRNNNPPVLSHEQQEETRIEMERIQRTSIRYYSEIALKLWKGANAFGEIISQIDIMGNENWKVIQDNSDAADSLVIQGPELIRALRTIAMHLDRTVMIHASNSD